MMTCNKFYRYLNYIINILKYKYTNIYIYTVYTVYTVYTIHIRYVYIYMHTIYIYIYIYIVNFPTNPVVVCFHPHMMSSHQNLVEQMPIRNSCPSQLRGEKPCFMYLSVLGLRTSRGGRGRDPKHLQPYDRGRSS